MVLPNCNPAKSRLCRGGRSCVPWSRKCKNGEVGESPSPPPIIPSPPCNVISLPVTFHVMRYKMNHNGLDMPMWVTCDQANNVIIPEINRLWQAAGIRFYSTGCTVFAMNLNPNNKQLEALRVVEQSDRAKEVGNGELNNRRKLAYRVLTTGVGYENQASLNAYFVPFTGSTRQGNALGADKSIIVGVWTNKPSNGRRSPVKTLLTEPLPFRHGSLSRTIAHEFGHCFGLPHPSPATQNLMSGSGYALTSTQINTARRKAQIHLRNFNTK